MSPSDDKAEARFLDVLKRYSATYSAELTAQRARLDELIGEAHWLSVGTYKEALVRRLLREKAPKSTEVGTGFVLAQLEGKRLISKQIDVLVWDATNHSPIFRDGEFVIIPPEACRAAIEVKGRLGRSELVEALENLERVTTLARFVAQFGVARPPFRAVFAFDIKRRTPSETDYVAWPDTIYNSLWKHYQVGDAAHPWPLAERVHEAMSSHVPGRWGLPWVDMVCVLGVGFAMLQEWGLNREPIPAYAAFDVTSDHDGTFSALDKALTRHLVAPEGLRTYDRPGLASVLLFDDERRSQKAFMPLKAPPETITEIGTLPPESVAQLAAAWHRPWGAPKEWPRPSGAPADEGDADAPPSPA